MHEITGLDIGLWQLFASPGIGTITWTAFVPDLATLERAGDALIGNDDFVKAIDKGADFFVGGFDDGLAQIIHGGPDPAREINYVTAVTSVCAPGHLSDGIAVGVEIAQKAQDITGTPTLFVIGMTGPYATVGWFTGFANIEQLDREEQAVYADPDFLKLIDGPGSTAYTSDPAASSQVIYRRIP